MTRKFKRILVVGALVAAGGAWLSGGVTRTSADQDDKRPPQTLPQGFESTDRLERDVEQAEKAPLYSAWLIESSRFVGVPPGSFMPDRAFIPGSTDPKHNIPFFDFPANFGVIKGPDGQITLYDSGWKQLAYIFDWNTSCCWWDAVNQLRTIGLDPSQVTRIVVGHGHWDHAGQLDSFPNAVLYIQKEELNQIDFFLDYPVDFNNGHIRAVNTLDPITGMQVGPPQQACMRTPVCGYPPQTLQEILGKVLGGKAKIVDGRFQVDKGIIIHPAFRGHTYGSQLLQVNTPRGQLVFGSDTYSSWEGIRDWFVANIQQTDTVQQFMAYEKCYVLASRQNSFNNCVSAHEPISYSPGYPLTANWWNPEIATGHCWRAAELILANGEPTHVPRNPNRTPCVDNIVPPHIITP